MYDTVLRGIVYLYFFNILIQFSAPRLIIAAVYRQLGEKMQVYMYYVHTCTCTCIYNTYIIMY